MKTPVLFFHGESKDGYKYTIAGIVKATIISKPSISAAISICSGRDVFSKRKGRLIAEGRLLCSRDVDGRAKFVALPQELKKNPYKGFHSKMALLNNNTKEELVKIFSL